MVSHSITRRDILTAFLGTTLASVACRRRVVVPEGDLVFASESLGHRIRDHREGVLPELSANQWEEVGIAIVGAGVAGLAAARALKRADYHDFVVLDLESQVGGTARGGRGVAGAYPWGAHYITAPMKENAELIAFLQELDLVEGTAADGSPMFRETALCREPQERLFAEGVWQWGLFPQRFATDEDRDQLARFRGLMESFAARRDSRGRRAFAVPMDQSSEDSEFTSLDQQSMASWMLAQGLDSPRLHWFVDYACRDDFGTHAKHTSAWAGIHYYASRLRGLGSEPQPILTWPEGNAYLVQGLARDLGTHFRLGLGALDVRVVARHDRTEADVVAIGSGNLARGFRAKRVIFAAPQFLAKRIVRDLRESKSPPGNGFEYGAWMVANITLRERPRLHRVQGTRMAWDNVIYDSPGLGYVVASHQEGRDHGATTLTYYYPLCDENPNEARRRLFAAGRDDWADVALADLETVHPDIRSLATRVDVVRWGHAMAKPRPGFLFGPDRRRASIPNGPIHFAHSDLSGIALFEEAFSRGQRAGTEALQLLRGQGA